MLAIIQPRGCQLRPSKAGSYWLLQLILLLCKASHAASLIQSQRSCVVVQIAANCANIERVGHRRIWDFLKAIPAPGRPADGR
jgi:hypothetical protein